MILKKINSIKDKIQEEILKINNLFEKTNEELTKSFKRKHELLNKEENDIREKLQNEVTKTKEKLENYLSLSNDEIKIYERINQGLKKIKSEEEKNMTKILAYVTKINKNQKYMNKLLQTSMKSLKFSYKEEKNNINYEEYFFNGIPYPINIEFKDITYNSLNISWKTDNINNINNNNNKIKY